MTVERRTRLALVLMVLGAALRTWQYVARGTLWLDEAAIARNILARSDGQLLQPLDYAQIAPRGFLLATKAAVAVFGPSEHALRLYSFVLSVLALPLIYKLARSLLTERAALLALAFFAVLGRPIFYASEAKQYEGDLFFAVLLLVLAVPILRGDSRTKSLVVFAAAGAVALWFSQPAIFIVAGIALGMVTRRPRPDGRALALLAIVAAGAPALYATLHALRPVDATYMRSFWQGGFLPWPSEGAGAFLTGIVTWPLRVVYGLFYDLLGMPVAGVGVGLALLGAMFVWQRERVALWILAGPLGAALVAGALHLFPVGTTLDGFNKLAAGNARVLLFLLPALVLLVAAGLDALMASSRRLPRDAGRVLAALTLGTPLFYALTEIPYTPHDLRPAISVLTRNARPGDRLYVYYGARQAFELYRARFPFADSAIVRGDCHRPDWREYLRELDALRGTGRVWVLMVRPALVNGVHEGQVIDDYLGQTAPRLARWGPKDAYLALYDMSVVRSMRGDPATWHLAPRRFPADTVPLGFSCAGCFPPPRADTSLTARANPTLR